MIWRIIGKILRSTGYLLRVPYVCFSTIIRNVQDTHRIDDVLSMVYTERLIEDGESNEVTRLISARMATSFEMGAYDGKSN